jgi:hypothetical protein
LVIPHDIPAKCEQASSTSNLLENVQRQVISNEHSMKMDVPDQV